MPRRYITAAEQEQVINRANRRCEYCKCLMDYSSQSFAIEHVIPISGEGETSLDNLALACGGCNGHKYTKMEAVDPISQLLRALPATASAPPRLQPRGTCLPLCSPKLSQS